MLCILDHLFFIAAFQSRHYYPILQTRKFEVTPAGGHKDRGHTTVKQGSSLGSKVHQPNYTISS